MALVMTYVAKQDVVVASHPDETKLVSLRYRNYRDALMKTRQLAKVTGQFLAITNFQAGRNKPFRPKNGVLSNYDFESTPSARMMGLHGGIAR